jgi:peptidoglycan hydrolase CwlO-like protein
MSQMSAHNQINYNQFGHSAHSGLDESHEDIRVLDDEILELQEYNAKVESEMLKLKLDINQMEEQVKSSERVNNFN